MSSAPTTAPSETIHGNQSLTTAWLVLNVWPSHFGLPLLIGIILLSRKVYRHPTFVNMCVTWMVDGLASSLLLWTGYQIGPEPPYGLCLAQGSLLYGMPALTAMSGFFVIYTVFYSLNGSELLAGKGTTPEQWRVPIWLMLVVPYCVWLICLVASVGVGASYPELVSRRQHYFFCAVNSVPLGAFQTAISSIILAATVVLLVRLIMVMMRQRKVAGFERSWADVGRLFRIIAFGFHSTVGIVLEIFSAQMDTSPVPHLAMATLGSGIILIFGTQQDILRALAFWKSDNSQDRTSTSAVQGCSGKKVDLVQA